MIKRWGSEQIIEENDRYEVKLLILTANTSMHYHKHKRETIIVISGQLKIYYDAGVEILNPGDATTIEHGVAHKMISSNAIYYEAAYSHLGHDSFRSDPLEPVLMTLGTLPLEIVSPVTDDECGGMFKDVLISQQSLPYYDRMDKIKNHTYMYDGYIYKHFTDAMEARNRVRRKYALGPKIESQSGNWFKYKHVAGNILQPDRLINYLDWMQTYWKDYTTLGRDHFANEFYYKRTVTKCGFDVPRVDSKKVRMCRNWHGDCGFENIINTGDGFVNIDFHGEATGDVYHDLAKILKSIYFVHDTITDDGTWSGYGQEVVDEFRRWCLGNGYMWDHINLIMALAILRMSAAHRGPLGENLLQWGKDELQK